jgi:hypothetical protein
MPLYFFIVDGMSPTADEGFELSDDSAARAEAELIFRDLSRNRGPEAGLTVVVVDGSGRRIAEIPQRD